MVHEPKETLLFLNCFALVLCHRTRILDNVYILPVGPKLTNRVYEPPEKSEKAEQEPKAFLWSPRLIPQ